MNGADAGCRVLAFVAWWCISLNRSIDILICFAFGCMENEILAGREFSKASNKRKPTTHLQYTTTITCISFATPQILEIHPTLPNLHNKGEVLGRTRMMRRLKLQRTRAKSSKTLGTASTLSAIRQTWTEMKSRRTVPLAGWRPAPCPATVLGERRRLDSTDSTRLSDLLTADYQLGPRPPVPAPAPVRSHVPFHLPARLTRRTARVAPSDDTHRRPPSSAGPVTPPRPVGSAQLRREPARWHGCAIARQDVVSPPFAGWESQPKGIDRAPSEIRRWTCVCRTIFVAPSPEGIGGATAHHCRGGRTVRDEHRRLRVVLRREDRHGLSGEFR